MDLTGIEALSCAVRSLPLPAEKVRSFVVITSFSMVNSLDFKCTSSSLTQEKRVGGLADKQNEDDNARQNDHRKKSEKKNFRFFFHKKLVLTTTAAPLLMCHDICICISAHILVYITRTRCIFKKMKR